MKNNVLLMGVIIILLSSCSPRISTIITKDYPMLESSDEIKIIEITEEIPNHSELLGELRIDDGGFATNCKYDQIIEIAKNEARKVGGNTIRLLSHDEPDFNSSCHRILANIYRCNYDLIIADELQKESLDSINDFLVSDIQTARDTIEVIKNGGATEYKYKGENLSVDRLTHLYQNNPQALNYFKKFKSSSSALSIFSYLGGAFIGYPIGTYLGGGQPLWIMAAIGGGALLIAVPIAISAKKNLEKSIDRFNHPDLTSSEETAYNISIGLNQNGLGLVIRF